MSGERKFRNWGEDPDAVVGLGIDWRKKERGFGKIGPVGEALHRSRVETTAVDDDCQRIAEVRPVGEDVELSESSLHVPELPFAGCAATLIAGGEVGDDDFRHLHHRLERIVAVVAVESLECGAESGWNDLPTHAPTVFAPSAHAFAATVADKSVPDAVDVVLRIACHLEADGLVVREVRPTVQCNEGTTEQFKLNREHRTFWVVFGISLMVACFPEAGIGEKINVELRGLERFGVESEIGRDACCSHVRKLLVGSFLRCGGLIGRVVISRASF